MNETGVHLKRYNGSIAQLNHAMGPVLAGMIIDVVDLVTFGPIGLVLGLPVGGVAGYWLGQSMGLKKNACFLCAMAAGIYCTIPFTELLPLGTLVGALVRYENSKPAPEAADSRPTAETRPPEDDGPETGPSAAG